MSQQQNDIFATPNGKTANGSSPVNPAQGQSSPEELFVGDVSFLSDLDIDKPLSLPALTSAKSKFAIRPLYLIAAANILVTVSLGIILWFSPVKVVFSQPSTEAPSALDSNSLSTSSEQAGAAQSVPISTNLTEIEQESLTNGVSLSLAETLLGQGNFIKASYVFRQILSNIALNDVAQEEFKDYLKLRIAACLQEADQPAEQENYLTDALSSPSPMVRGFGFYYLSLAQFRKGEYLQARRSAYQALALIKTFQDLIPANIEADLYFLAAESLTRYVLDLHPGEQELPGQLWSDSLNVIWPVDLNQEALCKAFETSKQKISAGAGGPQFHIDFNRPAGNQWSLVCLHSPVEEVLVKMASQTKISLLWQTLDTTARSRPVTIYLPYVAEQYLAEVLTGATGMVWKYDGQKASVFTPEQYEDFGQHRADVIGETVAIWRRFLLRYRGEHRTANAHYALGRIYNLDQQQATALAEFKVIQSHFGNNPLAPFAFLEASQIRTQIKDYSGAKADLNEMLLLYPNCTAADRATLYLAEASLKSGQTNEARDLFNKVYQLNLSKSGRLQAAYGLGRCAYSLQDWTDTKKWLSETLSQIEDKSDTRLADICLMLGQALIELGENKQASSILRVPLGGALSDTDYVQIIKELVQAEVKQENYLEALNILENIPQARLSQKDSCEAMIWKSKVLRSIEAAPSAAALIRRKIEYIADSRLRAWLTLELAESYYEMGDYSQARRELNDVLADMQDAGRARQAGLLLAKIAERLNQPEQAQKICLTILANTDLDPAIRHAAFELLGRVYLRQQAFDKAAMAFAGVALQNGEVQ